MKHALIVDGQVFQTPAWHRGMGKYSLELLQSLRAEQTKDQLEMMLILSSKLPTPKDVLSQIRKVLNGVDIIMLDLLPNDIGHATIAAENRRLIDAHIADNYTDNDAVSYLILSLMQGEVYGAFPSSKSVKKLVIMYDLIPLMFHDIYLRNPITRTEYLAKVGELLRADYYLAISKTVANDLVTYMGVDTSRIVSIDGGPIDHSHSSKVLKVSKPFILMPTGNDLRKNNRRGILGFKDFNELHDNKYTLVITSFFKEHEVEELSKLSDHVIFSGNVSGEELNYLYDESEALLFPTEYEGLGLPILEALQHDKPIACSNISVFREMSETAFCYFDPQSVIEIAKVLEQAVLHHKIDKQAYVLLLQKYTWEHTAQAVLAVMNQKQVTAELIGKPRLAVFGPDPSRTNKVGKWMQDLHGELSRQADVTYYLSSAAPSEEERVNYLPYIAGSKQIVPGFEFEAGTYDATVYHLANSKDFAGVLFVALARPGTVVLHDESLELAWQGMVEQGFVDSTRLSYEMSLSQVATSSSECLVSLLVYQNRLIVFDKTFEKRLRLLAERLQSNIVVERTHLPIASLVYPEARSAKTVLVRNFSELPAHQPDLVFNSERNKLRFIIVPDDQSIIDVLESMRDGVIPIVVTAAKSVSGISDELLIANTSQEALDIAKAIGDDAKAYRAQHGRIFKEIASAHSPIKFIEVLISNQKDAQ